MRWLLTRPYDHGRSLRPHRRKFIGIEKEPKYFDIAVKRIEAELSRMPLFEDAPAVVQKELL
jgi:DNA modification methylase